MRHNALSVEHYVATLASKLTKFYRLGDFDFQIKCSDPLLKGQLASLLPSREESIDVELPLVDIDLPLAIVPDWGEIVFEATGLDLIRLIVRRALEHHYGYLWFDAATLLSPSGKLVFLAGPSHSGKSTAATALAFGYGWKVLAEDVTLINPQTGTVLTFTSPISLRVGSLERIRLATGVVPSPVIGSEWLPIADHANEQRVDFNVDLALVFSVTDPEVEAPFSILELKSSTFLQSLLPLCNALHIANGIDLLDKALIESRCYCIEGGDLSERLNFIASCLDEQTSHSIKTVQHT